MAGAGMGAGIGMALGNAMGAAMTGMNQRPAGGAVPPPLPSAHWHVALGGEATGPHSDATVQAMAGDGRLTRDTLVWRDGMEGWEKAAQVGDLRSLFPSAPPPLPPQG